MPQIIPIKDLKDTAVVSDLCHRVDEPVFITKNGYGDMVLMSIEISEAQIKSSKTKDAKKALKSVRDKYGLT